ncbi:EF-Tu/IF-2/RF-3 family GTPase [Methanospirillum hungatei]|mgnify:FL=1|uniref:EF-Tu/IF-2/RF-3 family GTPase n=1 Tax=Methanospirillum hungatei TaxID=2203 RepID=UPI001B7A90FC|nr:EF-Tu/IF-2/RF-3 family GTPase [Methanospirillum hungatei]MBP7035017.1 elongation factor Tu [Methanospirillum sp.]MBP9009659.1 elongation factor Tu [Methanospirillum sp.]MCA1914931.1 elongation factor Tu [Methanospirillum hungatei]HOW04466.1 EF-Tu/IF-2/RF-3 family GTPase [Methanospirillum hungatei]
MPNLNIAYLGPEDLVKELGKKGTSTDITFYNMKKGGVTLTIIEPSRYPEKLSSLFYTASLADLAVLVIDALSAKLGEIILMLNAAGVKDGVFILRNYLDKGQIAPLIRGTVLEQYTELPDDPVVLREWLLNRAGEHKSARNTEKGSVPIDHHFNVKGIGTVILGCVQEGTIRRHDQLTVHPLGKQAQIRSIQMHDDDAEEASAGDRVGLALKGIEADDLDRGFVLSSDPRIISSLKITGTADIIPYWPQPLKEQMVLYAGHWMQFLPCRVSAVRDAGDFRKPTLTLEFERELIYLPGSVIILHYLESEKLRIVGTITIR